MADRFVVGSELPALALPPLARSTLALYAGGSGDHVPLHIDSVFAQAAGYPDVFMHGMLGMAYVGRLVTTWVRQGQVREFGGRFVAITYPGEVLTARGSVTEVDPNGRARLGLTLVNAQGETKFSGFAVVDPA